MRRKTTPDDQLVQRLEVAVARNAALTEALTDLVHYVRRVGGFMAQRDQVTLRVCESLLAESGRS